MASSKKLNGFRPTAESLISVIEFCQAVYINEYTVAALLQKCGIVNTEPYLKSPGFINKFILFISTLPLSFFENNPKKLSEVIKYLRQIITQQTKLAKPVLVHSGLSIIRPPKQIISYI